MSVLNKQFDKIYILYINNYELNRIKTKIRKRKIKVQYFKGYIGKNHMNEYIAYRKKFDNELIKKYSIRVNIKLLNVGSFGHIKSFINILTDAITNNYKKILILEPDVYFCKNFENKFKKYTNLDYKILYLGAFQYSFYGIRTWNNIQKFNPFMKRDGYYHPYRTLGTFAIALDRSVYEDYVKCLKKMYNPSDVCITDLQSKYNKQCYVCYPNIICCDVTNSSTGTAKRNQNDYMKKLKWNLIPYDITDSIYFNTNPLKNYKIILTVNTYFKNFIIHIDNTIINKNNIHFYKHDYHTIVYTLI